MVELGIELNGDRLIARLDTSRYFIFGQSFVIVWKVCSWHT